MEGTPLRKMKNSRLGTRRNCKIHVATDRDVRQFTEAEGNSQRRTEM